MLLYLLGFLLNALLIGAVWVVVGRMLVGLLRALLDEPKLPENGHDR